MRLLAMLINRSTSQVKKSKNKKIKTKKKKSYPCSSCLRFYELFHLVLMFFPPASITPVIFSDSSRFALPVSESWQARRDAHGWQMMHITRVRFCNSYV